MKKMWYTIVFILVLALLVFAGCKAFKLGGDDTDETDEPTVSDVSEDGSTTLPADPENATDAEGNPLYTPEEIASIRAALEASEKEEQQGELDSSASEPAASESDSSESNTDESSSAQQPADGTTEGTTEGTTAKEEPSSAPPANVSCKEYDALRSGKFYLEGSMQSEGVNNPITLAKGDNVGYMQATMDGVSMGILVKDGDTYLLNTQNKTYCEIGSVMGSILEQAGLPGEEELTSMINEMGFSSMKDLSEADSISKGTLGSTSCSIYTFNKEDGSKTRVYVKGDRLLALEILAANGKVDTATYFTKITSTIPQLPPSDYSKENLLTFITNIESQLG